jgi:Anti-sigma-K factor rskA, C-terminal
MGTHDDDRAAYLAGEERDLAPKERAELDQLRGVLGSAAAWAEPGPELEDRVIAAIADEATARPARPPKRRAPPRLRLSWPRPAYGLGALAAAVAAAAIAVVVATNGGSKAPQRLAMVIAGTGLAPDAKGSATLTKTGSGWRIELAATGLPRLANGRYYEAWLKSPAGVLVPVGTFNDARNVTLWAGVPPTEYSSMTVTTQSVGGGPASSGQRVLTGTIRPAH